MVSANELSGKKVVSLKGDEIGEVKDVDFDISKWQVTHLQMKLSSKAAVSLGYKKTIGSYTVCMPVEIISSVGDVVTINKTLLELAEGADIKECSPKHIRRGIKVTI
ncbi:MAG: PRC-barrel domain-containing protein [Candidatus Bathyarchaeia archaeon]